MTKTKTLDFARLLGFAAVNRELEAGLDFQDQTVGDRLGAKVGEVEDQGVALFQDQAVAAKLGAKRGGDIEPGGSA